MSLTPDADSAGNLYQPGDDPTDTIGQIIANPDQHRANRIRYAARTKGYKIEDVHFYSLGTLRQLTEAVLGGFTPAPQGDGRGNNDPAEGWNIHAAIADCSKGIYKLMPPEHRAVLLLHHAGYLEASEDSLTTAYTALQAALGGRRPAGL